VTVRPASSVYEETALASDRPRPDEEDELEDEEETETDECEDPREEALAWAKPLPRLTLADPLPGSGIVDRISRPSAVIRVMAQVPLTPFGAPAAATAVAPSITICSKAMAVTP
jgi:hypothetical protein